MNEEKRMHSISTISLGRVRAGEDTASSLKIIFVSGLMAAQDGNKGGVNVQSCSV